VASVRGTSIVLSLLLVSLAACAPVSGAAGPGPDSHSTQFQQGYRAGREARLQYGLRPGGTVQDLAAYCDEKAYVAIQVMKGTPVLWSEGFDAGCQSPL
jgi:hypothetical protein